MDANQLPSLADAPGTQREYETIYILRPTLSNDDVAEVNGRVRGIIEERGGKVLKLDNWGKRRLAYEINKERKGIYLYWQYLGGAEIVREFERNMRMLDGVLRYMTVKLDKDIDPTARPSDITDESYEQAAITAADEEDMFLRSSSGEEGSEEGGEDAGEDGDKAEVSAAGDAADSDQPAGEEQAASGETATPSETAAPSTETAPTTDNEEKA